MFPHSRLYYLVPIGLLIASICGVLWQPRVQAHVNTNSFVARGNAGPAVPPGSLPQAVRPIFVPIVTDGRPGSPAPTATTQPTIGATTTPAPTATTTPGPTTTSQAGNGAPPFWLPYDVNGTQNTTTPDVAIDPAGGIHVVYRTYRSDPGEVFYAYCPNGAAGGCTHPADFTTIAFDPPAGQTVLSDATLALDPAGHPRMVWAIYNTYLYWECNSACTAKTNWSSTSTITYTGVADAHSRRFAIDKNGHPSFVYVDDNHTYGGTDHYGTWSAACTAADCTTAANWHEAQVAPKLLNIASLAMTGDGRQRLAARDADDGNVAVYLECDAQCSSGGQWNGVVFSKINTYYSALSLAVGSDGLPRLALYSGDVSGSDYQAEQLYYLACTTACAVGGSNDWHSLNFGLPNRAGQNVSLALDPQNHPRLAYDGPTGSSGGAIVIATCDQSCDTAAPNWRMTTVDTIEALNQSDPVTTTSICSSPTHPTWALGYWVSLALDGSGNPRTAYDAHHLWICSSGSGVTVETDIAWARYKP